MTSSNSIFNKKKWLKNHLKEILRLKEEGLTHQAVIHHLIEQRKMPFELSESLLSRHLKDLATLEPAYRKENAALVEKVDQQSKKLVQQNNEIQNIKRRYLRLIDKNEELGYQIESYKERNAVLESKFLEGEARLKDLSRYNGYNNIHWKVKDIEQKNDDLLQTVLSLERQCENLSEPLEDANERIERLNIELSNLVVQFEITQNELEQAKLQNSNLAEESKQKDLLINQLEAHINELMSKPAQPGTVVNQSNQLDQEQLIQKEKNRRALESNIMLKQHIRRLQKSMEETVTQLSKASEKLNQSKVNANQSKILAYAFMLISLILLIYQII